MVTGASSGLGEQFARALSRAGAGVVLAARRLERLKTLRAELEAEGGDAHVVELDVTDHDSIRAAVAHAETEMGTIDILVNNSGISTTQKLVDVTPDDYDDVMAVNTRGAFFVAQSGQPWEMLSYEPYRALTTSTSNTNRYAEKAGSRRTDAHHQIDLNYTQDIQLKGSVRLQLIANVFNLYNKQTGYNIQPEFNSSAFGLPRNYYDPRRLELTARLRF